ncbi:MAG: hypothetical protein PWR13_650 [Archaeoglobi archaeon]|nr:hypothetical protein [Archaeoglobi archaeon]
MRAKLVPVLLSMILFLSHASMAQEISSEWVIAIQKDGSAEISIKHIIPVESQEIWDELSESLDEQMLSSYQQTISEIIAELSESTGREMSIHSWSIEKKFVEDHGEIVISFVWENFCSSGEGKLNLEVLEGFVIPEGTKLVIRAPEGTSFSEVSPPADEMDESSVTYIGPNTLENLRITLSGAEETPGFELAAALIAAFLATILLKANSRV